MTCGDCFHYGACKNILKDFDIDIDSFIITDMCEQFQDCLQFVKLPSDFISKAELKRELSAQCAVNKLDDDVAKDMLNNLPYIRVKNKQQLSG